MAARLKVTANVEVQFAKNSVFAPEDTFDIETSEAQSLLDSGAIRLFGAPKPGPRVQGGSSLVVETLPFVPPGSVPEGKKAYLVRSGEIRFSSSRIHYRGEIISLPDEEAIDLLPDKAIVGPLEEREAVEAPVETVSDVPSYKEMARNVGVDPDNLRVPDPLTAGEMDMAAAGVFDELGSVPAPTVVRRHHNQPGARSYTRGRKQA